MSKIKSSFLCDYKIDYQIKGFKFQKNSVLSHYSGRSVFGEATILYGPRLSWGDRNQISFLQDVYILSVASFSISLVKHKNGNKVLWMMVLNSFVKEAVAI